GAAGLGRSSAAEGRRARAAAAPGAMLSADEMAAVDQALGKKGTVVADQAIYTVPLPRADLKVKIKDAPVPTGFGFGGWVAFKKMGSGDTMFMSDTVLQPVEVNSVISAAHANGIEVTAIHNHFFYEEPRVFYMHLHGHGPTAELARAYAAAIRSSPLFPANQPPPSPPSGPGAMALLEPEVNPVVHALRANNLEVVALHHHMLGEEPRIIFLHYYGTGPAETLARGFRAALDELGKHGSSMRMTRMRR